METHDTTSEVQALVEAWIDMWNAYDLDRIENLFIDDPRLSYLSSEREGAFFGMEAVREHHEGFGFVQGGKAQPNRLWLEDVQYQPFGDIFIVTGIWHFLPVSRPEMRGPVTFVCENTEQGFRFVHLNFGNYR